MCLQVTCSLRRLPCMSLREEKGQQLVDKGRHWSEAVVVDSFKHVAPCSCLPPSGIGPFGGTPKGRWRKKSCLYISFSFLRRPGSRNLRKMALSHLLGNHVG